MQTGKLSEIVDWWRKKTFSFFVYDLIICVILFRLQSITNDFATIGLIVVLEYPLGAIIVRNATDVSNSIE